jgi:signal transduction histidine kinase
MSAALLQRVLVVGDEPDIQAVLPVALGKVGGVESVHVRSLDASVPVSVKDNSPGIPANFEPRVFEKFAQADSSRTGLELSISKTLVEQMGGRIDFGSLLGVRTCFVVDFPRA